jgi:hypothetical protein
MKSKQTVRELIDYYRDMERKGLEEIPIQKLTVQGCEIINTNEKETEYFNGHEITYTFYACIYKGYRYEINAYANVDLLEFVESILTVVGPNEVDFKKVYYREKVQ